MPDLCWRKTMPDLSDHLRALDRAESPDLWEEIRSRRPGPPIKPPGSLLRHVALLAVVVIVSAGAGVGIWAGLKTSATTGPSAVVVPSKPASASSRALKEAEHLLGLLRLPAGSKPSSGPPAGSASQLRLPFSSVASPDQVDLTRYFTVPGAPTAVLAWVKDHAPIGGSVTGTGGSGGAGPSLVALSFGWSANSASIESAQLLLEAVAMPGRESALRVDSEVVWLPKKNKADLVPANDTVFLSATFDRAGGQQKTDTTNPSVIERLRQAIDRLPIEPPGAQHCPADLPGGAVTLLFQSEGPSPLPPSRRHPTEKPAIVRADASGCGTVTITVDGKQGRPLSGGPGIVALASRLLLTRSSPKAAARCLPAQLRLSSDHSGWHANLAATGQFVETFTVTNVSSTDCSLGGWPSLQAVVAGKAETVKSVRVRQGGLGAKTWTMLTLQPGRTASFDIYGVDWNAIKNRSCPATTSGFLITLPGEPTAVSVTAPEPDCGSFYVAPLIAGSSDHQAWSSVVAG